ncbi:uncharacterized protein LOC112573575 [Pomacea canaliculata]|nr:uncharacterized protein LOC112573575 [Pomacea canaliculata]
MPGAGPWFSCTPHVSSCSSNGGEGSGGGGGGGGCPAITTAVAAAAAADVHAVVAEAAGRPAEECCVLQPRCASVAAIAGSVLAGQTPQSVALPGQSRRVYHDLPQQQHQQPRRRQQDEILVRADVFLYHLLLTHKYGMNGDRPYARSHGKVRYGTERLRADAVAQSSHPALLYSHHQRYSYHDHHRRDQHHHDLQRLQEEASLSENDSDEHIMAGSPLRDQLHQQELYHDNNPDNSAATKQYPLPPAFQNGCKVGWTWNTADKSHEVRLCGRRHSTALFHPNWSNGTAGVRGTRPLNGGVHYWEVRVSSRVFGTSMMFGVATARARLHVDAFVNLVGEDRESWGMSHKGLLWHGGRSRVYTAPFRENEATTIGVFFDGLQGTLTFYKDGECLGLAFSGLDSVQDDIFPVVCSTAAKTEMTLGVRRRAFLSLQDRCRAVVVGSLCGQKKVSAISKLPLPNPMRQYIREEAAASAL